MSKVALVTGANRGIGFAIACQLAERGLRVLSGVRSEARVAEAAREFANAGVRVTPVVVDMADADGIPEALARAAEEALERRVVVQRVARLGRCPQSRLYRRSLATLSVSSPTECPSLRPTPGAARRNRQCHPRHL